MNLRHPTAIARSTPLALALALNMAGCGESTATEDATSTDGTGDETGSEGMSDETGSSSSETGTDTGTDSESETSTDGESEATSGDGDGDGDNDSTLPDTDPDCNEETFLDPALFQNPGGSAFSPDYTVTCANGIMTIAGNNIPHYEFTQTTPNALAEATVNHQIPLDATWSDTPARFSTLGAVGVAVNGTNLQSPSEAGNLSWGDPVFDMALDYCNGHTGFGGAYHSHAITGTCYFPNDDGSIQSPILGWAYDGYAIYGTMGCTDSSCDTLVEMRSSYTQLNDPTDCVDQSFEYAGDADESDDGDEFLDECNGHFGPEGDYHYHATTEYPYLVGCYHGEPGPSAALYGGQIDTQMEAACEDGVCTGTDCGMMGPP